MIKKRSNNRKNIRKYIKRFQIIVSKSQLTEKDADELSEKIKKSMSHFTLKNLTYNI